MKHLKLNRKSLLEWKKISTTFIHNAFSYILIRRTEVSGSCFVCATRFRSKKPCTYLNCNEVLLIRLSSDFWTYHLNFRVAPLKQLAHIEPRPQSALVQTAQEQKHRVILRIPRVFVRCKEGGGGGVIFECYLRRSHIIKHLHSFSSQLLKHEKFICQDQRMPGFKCFLIYFNDQKKKKNLKSSFFFKQNVVNSLSHPTLCLATDV